MAAITITGNVANIIKANFGVQYAIIEMPEIRITTCLKNSASVTENALWSCSTSAVIRLVSSPTLLFS